jgi:hypothetical protein
MNLRSKSIPELKKLTANYHETNKLIRTLFEKYEDLSKMSIEDAIVWQECMKSAQELKAQIIKNLSLEVRVLDRDKVFYLKQDSGYFLKFSPHHIPNTVITTRVEMVGSIGQATKFNSREDAEAQLGPANFAAFNSYITGIGSNK